MPPDYVPTNLDDATLEELYELEDLYTSLARYTSLIVRAKEYREAGEIDTALDFEDRADTVYFDLPEWAQW